MSGLSRQITIEEFQQMMASDAQTVPAFLQKIANGAKPADVRMLKVVEGSGPDVEPQTSWAGWR
jgi:hypothetical protein